MNIARRLGKQLVWVLCLYMPSGPALGQAAPHAEETGYYKVIAIPLKPSNLSNSGEVVGTTEDNRAATWSRKKGLRLLPVRGFSESEANSSNENGWTVGHATTGGQTKAFVYQRGRLTMLEGKNSRALAVNDHGEIVGQSAVNGKIPVTAVVWQNGTPRDVGGCCGGIAKGINNAGQVIGDLYDEGGRYRAFLWEREAGLKFIAPPNRYSSAIAINRAGRVLVQELEHGIFLFLGNDRRITIEIPGHQPADGRALNNADEVVGAFGPYFDADRAFLWNQKSGFRE